MQPDGSIEYQRNADVPFVAASLYKLILLVNIYEKREAGKISFDQELELLPEYFPDPDDFADGYYDRDLSGTLASIDELMYATATFSSNVAAHALLSLTDPASLDLTTIELGLEQTFLFIDVSTIVPWQTTPESSTADLAAAEAFIQATTDGELINVTTPRDMARFFQLLLDGNVVNARVSADLLATLKQQMVDDRFPYLLPYPTDMAHKTGNLDHVVHDVGVIWTPQGPVILAAMVENPPDDDRATQIVQRLALIAYGEYDVPPFTDVAVPEASEPADE
jgi:beta-lactamase class A